MLAFQISDPLLQISFVAMGKQQIQTLDVYIVLQSLELYKDVKTWLTSKIVVLKSFCYTRILPNPVILILNRCLLSALIAELIDIVSRRDNFLQKIKKYRDSSGNIVFSLARLLSTHLITSLKVGILKIYQLERERNLSSISSLIVTL